MDIRQIYSILENALKDYTLPLAEQIDIKTKNPFFVLVGTILSSRTKDEMTARVCDRLFKVIKVPEDLVNINQNKLEELLYGVGFYKTKASNLRKMAKRLIKDYNGIVPDSIEELIKLEGVGRKTANLVLSVAFNKPAICVDTHVHRITNRLGYIKTKSPLETEMVLREKLPSDLWQKTNYLFVILGQNICRPIGPKCNICPITDKCGKIGVRNV